MAPDAIVLVSKSKSTTAKSTHVLHHCFQTEEDGSTHHIGTHPQTANVLAQSLLLGGHVFDRPVKAIAKEVSRRDKDSYQQNIDYHLQSSVYIKFLNSHLYPSR